MLSMTGKTNKLIAIVSALVLCALLLVPAVQASDYAGTATSTYYNTKWYTLWTIRDKIVSTKTGSSVTTGSPSIVLRGENNTSVTQKFSYSYSKTLSASASLGAKVPAGAIELEFGGSISYSSTTTISAEVSVPAHHAYSVKKRQDTRKNNFRSTVQEQWLYTDGSWRNEGSPSTVYSTVTESYTTLVISN